MEEKHFSFFDGSSPSYMLVNTEVAEGDIIEGFPLFAKRLGSFFLIALFFGSLGYLFASRKVNEIRKRKPRPCKITRERSKDCKPSNDNTKPNTA